MSDIDGYYVFNQFTWKPLICSLLFRLAILASIFSNITKNLSFSVANNSNKFLSLFIWATWSSLSNTSFPFVTSVCGLLPVISTPLLTVLFFPSQAHRRQIRENNINCVINLVFILTPPYPFCFEQTNLLYMSYVWQYGTLSPKA